MPTINTVILQKNAGESDADHAVRVMGVATQLNNELGDVLENLRARTVELAAVNSQKKGWMIGTIVVIVLFFLVLIGAPLLSVRPTQGDMDIVVKRESDKLEVANKALQACQNKPVPVCNPQSDSYGKERDVGILLERTAQGDKKLDVLVARPQPQQVVVRQVINSQGGRVPGLAVAPTTTTSMVATGGCIAVSDGTAKLGGLTATNGTEVARISDAELIKQFPNATSNNNAHLEACKSWRKKVATAAGGTANN